KDTSPIDEPAPQRALSAHRIRSCDARSPLAGPPFSTLPMNPTMSAPTAHRRLILLVDDDALLLDYLSTILRHAGYDTLEAASAPEALQRIAEREGDDGPEIALALLDINMPGMSGLDLARRL